MGRVRWTEAAARWLEAIHDHVAQDSPETALRVVREIHRRAETLTRFPERGYRYATSWSGTFGSCSVVKLGEQVTGMQSSSPSLAGI